MQQTSGWLIRPKLLLLFLFVAALVSSYIFFSADHDRSNRVLCVQPPSLDSNESFAENGSFAYSSSKPQFKLYLHPQGDFLSDHFRKSGVWPDCERYLSDVAQFLPNKRQGSLVIVDVGAMIGACSMLFASRGNKVYSFEPTSFSSRLLMKSIANNELLGNITLTTAGASNDTKLKKINIEVGNFGNSIVGEASKDDLNKANSFIDDTTSTYFEETIRLTTIDSVVAEHVDFMKLDCQGHEINAVLGAKKVLEYYKVDLIAFEFGPPWIRLHGFEPIVLLNIFDGYGYEIILQEEAVLYSEWMATSKIEPIVENERKYTILKKDNFEGFLSLFSGKRFTDLIARKRN